MATPLRLNLGCGDKPIDGFENIDRKNGQEAYPLADYADDSVDEIRASHILEHFGHGATRSVLTEWRRVLRPGGLLRVAVPDFDKVVAGYLRGREDWPTESFLMGGQTDADDAHGAIFNRQKLVDLLREVGFAGFRSWQSEIEDCAAYEVSLNVACRKVDPASWEPKGIQACLSHPRLAHTECMFNAVQALTPLKIQIRRGGGVFWNHAMQTMMEQIVADGSKYILTMDYDAMFSSDDIVMLYDLMERRPDIAALCPVQIGRDRDGPLFTVGGPDGKNLHQIEASVFDNTEALPIRSGHFACCLIRCSAIADLPKPWLKHEPDRNGGWGEGRIDDDIWFWRLLERHGRTAALATKVGIGHVQVVVTWPRTDLTATHQYQMHYNERGKPAGVI